MSKAADIREELERIRSADKQGRLRPEAVIEYAKKNKGSALYAEFTWDDGEAADLYRLEQARKIIRVVVTVVTPPNVPTVVSVKEYVSLSDQRGDGYEEITAVLADQDRAQVLLEDVIKRLLGIKEVQLFEELASVNRAIQKAAALYLPKPPKDGIKGGRIESARV